jgi:hypothetical protein
MNTSTIFKLLKPFAVWAIVWYTLLILSTKTMFVECVAAAPRAYIANLAWNVRDLKGQSLSRDELESLMSKKNMTSSYNRYTYQIDYCDATNWTVRLQPQFARTYDSPWYIRVLFLETSKTTYPDIEVSYDNFEVIRKPKK